MEIRVKDTNLQCLENGSLELGGYINVTERQSEMLFSQKRNKWFKETMKKGVFQRAIDKANGIPLLLEHDWDKQLANTNDGSLELIEDNIGLKFRAIIEDKDIYEQVKQGEINACSFGFRALHQQIEGVNERFERRFVDEIELKEVSLVQNPAYVGSLVETRAMLEEEIKMIDSLTNETVEEKRAKTEKKEEDQSEKESDNKTDSELEDKDSKKDSSKKKLSENSESSEKEDDEDKEVEENEENEKPKEKRDLGEVPSNVESDSETLTKENVEQIVQELVNAKLQEIQQAEQEEEKCNQILSEVQEFHKEVEKEIEADCMKHNLQVMRLRTDYMKLCKLKRIY